MTQEKIKKRGATYPSVTLKQATELTRKIVEAGLGGGPYTRQVISHTLGYSDASGLIAAKMAACVHFGIMTNNGKGYCLSSIGKELVNPSPDDNKHGLIEAIKQPTLYAALIRDFNGQTLPADLEVQLMESYNVNPAVAPKVARVFRTSLEYVGALKRNRVCYPSEHADEREVAQRPTVPPVEGSTSDGPSPETIAFRGEALRHEPIEGGDIHIALPETGIVVSFPKKYAYDLGMGTFSAEIAALHDKALNAQKGGKM